MQSTHLQHAPPIGWAVSLRRGVEWITDTARGAGLQLLQLSYVETLDDPVGIERVRAAAESIGAQIIAMTFGFAGEDWSDVPAIYRTCGLAPASTRAQRRQAFHTIARFAGKLGVKRLAGHVGHLPADAGQQRELAGFIRALCAELADHGQVLSMETGQEPAGQMEQFLLAADCPSLTVNFDPANFILYANDDPWAAWRTLRPWVDAIHCKDALPPTDPQHLGTEARLGEGAVQFEAWLRQALEDGFTGPLLIETGIKGDQFPHDLLRARQLVQRIATEHRAVPT